MEGALSENPNPWVRYSANAVSSYNQGFFFGSITGVTSLKVRVQDSWIYLYTYILYVKREREREREKQILIYICIIRRWLIAAAKESEREQMIETPVIHQWRLRCLRSIEALSVSRFSLSLSPYPQGVPRVLTRASEASSYYDEEQNAQGYPNAAGNMYVCLATLERRR